MTDEQIRLGLDMGPTAKTAAEATRATEALKTSVQSTHDVYDVLDAGIAAVDRHMDQLTRETIEQTQAQRAMALVLRETAQEQGKLAASMVTVGTAASKLTSQGGASGSMAGAMGLMGLAQMLDDVQYGFRSIVNNIPMVSTAVGQAMGFSVEASMKFAGALGVAGVAINQLIQHGDKLAGSFKPFEDILHGLSTWFEGTDVFKQISSSITNLSSDVEKLPGQLRKIKDAIEEIEKTTEADRNLFQVEKLAGLQQAKKEAEQRLADEKAIAGMEDEQVKKNRAAAQKAFGQIPGGAEAVRGYLTQEGVSPEEARRMVAGAGRGVGQDLEDILSNIKSDIAAQQFAPLFHATTEGQRQDEEAAAQIKIHEKQQEETKRATEKREREAIQDREKEARDADKAAKEAQRDDRQRIRDEQRRIEASDRRNAQTEAIRRRNVQRAPVAQLEQATSQLSQQMGFGTPNAVEANQMADAALKNINDGVNAQQAVWLAVMQKVEAIKAATARANGQLGQMQKQTQSGLGN